MSARSLNIHGPKRQGNITIADERLEEGDVVTTKVFLHGNKIAEINWATSLVKISSQGWYTPTTKTAINNVLKQLGAKAYIYQEDFTWYINVKMKNSIDNTEAYETFEFLDGMFIQF